MDASAWTPGSATDVDAYSNTWTIYNSGTAEGARLVSKPHLWLDTDDYLYAPDHADLDFALADSFTVVVAAMALDATPAADGALVAKKANLTTAAGYAVYLDTGGTANGVVGDGTFGPEDASAALTDRTIFVAGLVRDVAADDIEAFKDGVGSGSPTTDTNTATSVNALALTIGAVNAGASGFFVGEFYSAALFREALTATEIAALQSEMLPGGGSMMLMGIG